MPLLGVKNGRKQEIRDFCHDFLQKTWQKMKMELILPRLALKEHQSIRIIPENVASYSLICFFATFHYLNEVYMDIQILTEQ